jgi:hypothetical protein
LGKHRAESAVLVGVEVVATVVAANPATSTPNAARKPTMVKRLVWAVAGRLENEKPLPEQNPRAQHIISALVPSKQSWRARMPPIQFAWFVVTATRESAGWPT